MRRIASVGISRGVLGVHHADDSAIVGTLHPRERVPVTELGGVGREIVRWLSEARGAAGQGRPAQAPAAEQPFNEGMPP
jgi:hypothetical protein